MQALSTAKQLNWRDWLRGLIGAFVSGGAGAVGTFAGVETVLDVGMAQTLQIMGIASLVSAIVSIGKFLQTTPVPGYEQPEPPTT